MDKEPLESKFDDIKRIAKCMRMLKSFSPFLSPSKKKGIKSKTFHTFLGQF